MTWTGTVPTEIGAWILALALSFSDEETEAQRGQLTDDDTAGIQRPPYLTLAFRFPFQWSSTHQASP